MLSDLYIRGIALQEADGREDSYVFSLPAVKNLENLELTKRVTFFVGENGSGKSTLLEAIAVNVGFNPEGGTKNFCFSTKETHSPLHKYVTVSKGIRRPKDGFFLRAESFYNVASEVDRLDTILPLVDSYGGKSLHCQSHGEAFLSLVMNRFGGNGLYILDEPEAALSPSRQLSLLARIHQLVKADSQFLIATHSPILMAYPCADIFLLGEDGIRPTPYEETEHYFLTKQFLNSREQMLKELLK